ncbi:hypothetical protein F5883DRAFT_538115 [Diaporthe sp. PMI_573]|nr:hypothetical protein F5883DRAFT_538115 [Diaporthaceae sp. PMI_573]
MASLPNHRSLPEAILVWFLEVLGAVTAILFGVFGVMSWKAADEANQKSDIANSRSDTANIVALVALCAQLTTGYDARVSSFTWATMPIVYIWYWRRTKNKTPLKQPLVALCNGIEAAAAPTISAIASSFFGDITPTTITSDAADWSSLLPISTITTTSDAAASISTSTISTSTSWIPSGPPQPSTASGSSRNSVDTLALGLGIGLGCVVAFISGMTAWAIIKKRRTPPEVPAKDQ